MKTLIKKKFKKYDFKTNRIKIAEWTRVGQKYFFILEKDELCEVWQETEKVDANESWFVMKGKFKDYDTAKAFGDELSKQVWIKDENLLYQEVKNESK